MEVPAADAVLEKPVSVEAALTKILESLTKHNQYDVDIDVLRNFYTILFVPSKVHFSVMRHFASACAHRFLAMYFLCFGR